MEKIDIAVILAASLYNAPIDMMSETHPEVVAYMRMKKSTLARKLEDLCDKPTLNATKPEREL